MNPPTHLIVLLVASTRAASATIAADTGSTAAGRDDGSKSSIGFTGSSSGGWRRFTLVVSVISQFDGLLIKFDDGQASHHGDEQRLLWA